MKINCISCGHSVELGEAYEDFEGLVRCYVCGTLLELRMSEGKLRYVHMAGSGRPLSPADILKGEGQPG